MEFTKKEVEMIGAIVDAVEMDVRDLDELQMTLVGGGFADPIAY